MNKTMIVTVLALAALTPARAQTALQELKLRAGEDAVAAAAQVPAARAAVQPDGGLVSVPLNAKDALAACPALNDKAFSLVEWSLPQAVGQIQSCLNKVYAAGEPRGYVVSARAGRFTVPLCPPRPGMMSCQAVKLVEGIRIAVEGELLTGDPVLMDLDFAIKSRGGKLLGWSAMLDDRAEILH